MTTSPQAAPSRPSDSADEALALVEQGSRPTSAYDAPFDQDGASSGAWHGTPESPTGATSASVVLEDAEGTLSPAHTADWSAHWSTEPSIRRDVAGASAASTEYHAAPAPGLTGRALALTATATACLVAGLDVALTGRISYFFDLCFVVLCLTAAAAVRRRDAFTAGVLPPLLLALVIAGAALIAPETLAASGRLTTVFVKGLASHADALMWGFAVALVTVGVRKIAGRDRP